MSVMPIMPVSDDKVASPTAGAIRCLFGKQILYLLESGILAIYTLKFLSCCQQHRHVLCIVLPAAYTNILLECHGALRAL